MFDNTKTACFHVGNAIQPALQDNWGTLPFPRPLGSSEVSVTVVAVTWVEGSGRQAFHDRCLATGAMFKQVLQGRIPGLIRCLQLYIEFVPYMDAGVSGTRQCCRSGYLAAFSR